MKRTIILAFGMVGLATTSVAGAQDKVVVQYDAIPNYANWGGVTAAYQKATGVRVPPDMKGSSAAMAALEAEKANPQADVAYYSGGIGFQASTKGLHDRYKPKGFDRIPAGLKDPNGEWFTVHTAHIAFLVNTKALGARPIPRSFADLLKPIYKGLIVYDDPTIQGTGFTFVYGINTVLGGGPDARKGFDYLKALAPNMLYYAKDNSYNALLSGEVPIWINADGNGLKAKWTDKAPIEVVIPSEGTITMPLVMALVKGAPHKVAAEKYLDWLLGDAAQALMAESYFTPVMKTKLAPELVARFLPASAFRKARTLPLATMAANADATKQRWLREVKSGS